VRLQDCTDGECDSKGQIMGGAYHRGGMPRLEMLKVLPTQVPVWPRVMLTFSSSVIWETSSRARA